MQSTYLNQKEQAKGLGVYPVFFHSIPMNGEKRETTCTLVDLKSTKEEPIVLAKGLAVCSKKDNFCREMGRRISFGRAIKELIESVVLRIT